MITPPVRTTGSRVHLLWAMRPDTPHEGERTWACVTLCHPLRRTARYTETEAPELTELTPISCWTCRETARHYPDVAVLVSRPIEPDVPMTPHPPRQVDAQVQERYL